MCCPQHGQYETRGNMSWGALHFLAYQCGIEKTTTFCFMLMNYSGASYIEASVCHRSVVCDLSSDESGLSLRDGWNDSSSVVTPIHPPTSTKHVPR